MPWLGSSEGGGRVVGDGKNVRWARPQWDVFFCVSGPLTEEGQTAKVITPLLLLAVTQPRSNVITLSGPQSKVIPGNYQ